MAVHPGIQLACSMWALTLLSLALVAARLYTRIRIIKFVGAEDHMYAWTGVFLLVFTCSIQVCVHYGLGRSFWDLSLADSSDAIFWTYVANSFAITGNAMAKLSMGLFLLRVVQIRWHKIALWFLVVVTVGTSIALTIMLWNQTTPVKASWDPIRTPGTWNIQIQPLSVGLGAWSSACDFFFAIFPWLFIWSLRMPQREKIMLAGGMSIGVIAGICGIVRTIVLSRLDVYNYTLNFVPYFGWAGAEIAVAMFCVGIPTLRPLYMKKRHGLTTEYGNRGHPSAVSDDRLPRFTMVDQKKVVASPATIDADMSQSASSPHLDISPEARAAAMLDARVLAAAAAAMEKPVDLESGASARDSGSFYAPRGEESFGAFLDRERARELGGQTPPSIPGRPVTAHMRSFSNNINYQGHSRGGSGHRWREDSLARPATAHTASSGHSINNAGNYRWRDDSVDAILGLYDRSIGGAAAAAARAGGDRRGIWVRNEVHIKREEDSNWPLKS
ncbi:hypothetical protein RB595_006118 [Gaeumannomyces hyphopodioides]